MGASQNIFAGVFGKPESVSEAPLPKPPEQNNNIFAGVLNPSAEEETAAETPQPSLLQKTENFANKPIAPLSAVQAVSPLLEIPRKLAEYYTQQATVKGNSLQAGIAQFYAGTLQDVEKYLQAQTSPLNLALWGTGIKEIQLPFQALKAVRAGILAYYAYESAKAAYQSKLPGESDPDYVQRKLFGLTGLYLTGVGAGATATEALHNHLQNRFFGGSKGLSAKVAEHMQQLKEATDLWEEYNRHDIAAKAEAEANADKLTQALEKTKEDIEAEGARVQRNFATIVKHMKDDLGAKFDEIEEKIGNTPLMNAMDLHGLMEEAMKEYDVSPIDAEAIHKNITNKYIPKALQEAPLPPEILKGVIGDNTKLNFNDLKNLREDLYRKALRADKNQVRAAMLSAANKVLEIQQGAAEKAGVAEQYAQLRQDYAKLMEYTAASDTGRQLLNQATIDDRNQATKMAAFLAGKDTTRNVRDIFKAFNVDTSPLDKLHEDAASIKQAIKDNKPNLIPKELRNEAREAIKKALAPEQGTEAAVPGVPYNELTDKTEFELRKMRVEKLMQNARNTGMYHPFAFLHIMFGLMGLLTGHLWGAGYGFGFGGSQLAYYELLRNPKHAAWIAAESGYKLGPTLDGIRKLIPQLLGSAAGMANKNTSPQQ